ncbi:hypothetical protein DVR12_10105 [Chitinophaga silvatica]|uniref:Uncharacterized protein n=1 Tax=Chitinophaga silvatica TaxID=2282649 RepID=A0A3E1YBI8_9BACT|nr:hypothetical protein [Chitinophaga silvatica]RFS23361.1 hypothetical protein DVR12_10105 [Chitinophaga silvatica]
MKKKSKNHDAVDYPEKQKPVKVLATDKGTYTTNPLHASLSEKPEKENKGVRHTEKNKSKH